MASNTVEIEVSVVRHPITGEVHLLIEGLGVPNEAYCGTMPPINGKWIKRNALSAIKVLLCPRCFEGEEPSE